MTSSSTMRGAVMDLAIFSILIICPVNFFRGLGKNRRVISSTFHIKAAFLSRTTFLYTSVVSMGMEKFSILRPVSFSKALIAPAS
jgi:hypothetical protein